MSFSDQQILEEIQYAMLEPPNLGATWPSGLWTQAEILRYINQRQHRFLKTTHAQVGIADIPATIGQSTYSYPDDWIHTVRMLWIPLTGAPVEVISSDSWEADYGIPSWTTVTGTPLIYIDSEGETLTFDAAPIPDVNGKFQILYIPLAVEVDGTGEIFTLPDEMVPTIKWGAMGDMLGKVARATDPTRADYCNHRFDLGCEITTMLLNGFR